jgi:heme/copper-type cytochrome/quinol oxidase subunit 2
MVLLRRLLWMAIGLGVLLWLVLSYVPSTWVSLPTLAFPDSWISGLFPVLALAALVVFAGIQLWLLWSVRRLPPGPADFPVRIQRRTEFFWTALPLLMTLGLAAASYPVWRDLVVR